MISKLTGLSNHMGEELKEEFNFQLLVGQFTVQEQRLPTVCSTLGCTLIKLSELIIRCLLVGLGLLPIMVHVILLGRSSHPNPYTAKSAEWDKLGVI